MPKTSCEEPFRLDRHACFTAPATQIAKLLGHPAKEVEGKRMDLFVTREDGPVFLEVLVDAYRGNTTKNVCIDMIAHGGKLLEVDARFEPEKYNVDGEVVAIKGTVCHCKRRKP